MKKVFVIGLFLSAVLFSCNNAVEINDDQLKDNKQEAVNKTICLELSFPITYIMPDGTTITGNDRKEVGTAMSSWHDANPDSKERAVMQYPVNANFKGKSVTINTEEEMQKMRKECAERKEPCFVFIYPITYILPDGSTITVNSEDDRENKKAIRAWYGENQAKEERPAIQYPIDVKLKDGTTATLKNNDDMKKVRVGCK